MSPKQSPMLDAQALARDHEDTTDVTTPEVEPALLDTSRPARAAEEPSPSERLYEAYRLWAFTGR